MAQTNVQAFSGDVEFSGETVLGTATYRKRRDWNRNALAYVYLGNVTTNSTTGIRLDVSLNNSNSGYQMFNFQITLNGNDPSHTGGSLVYSVQGAQNSSILRAVDIGYVYVGSDGTYEYQLWLKDPTTDTTGNMDAYLNCQGYYNFDTGVSDVAQGGAAPTNFQNGVVGVLVDRTGNVGIGKTDPGVLLDLKRDSVNGSSIRFESSGGYKTTIGQKSSASTDRSFQFTSTPYAGSSPAYKFLTQNSTNTGYIDALNITGDGNVGIGTTNPLSISTSNPISKLNVYDNVNSKTLLSVNVGAGRYARTEINSGIRFDTSTSEYFSGGGGSGFAYRDYHIRFNANRQLTIFYDGDDLEFSWGGGGNYAIRASIGASNTFGWTFTGQHRNFIKDVSYMDVIKKNLGGLIVCANNNEYVKISDGIAKGANAITQNEALPVVSLCTKAMDKSCFGVISESEDPESKRSGSLGMFKSYYNTEEGDKRVIINSVGEGAIWVTNINGSLESGDYITTSNVAGYGQKQESEFLANYTVAKITMDCDFNPATQPIQIIKKELQDVNYWVKTTYENVTEEEYSNLTDENRQIVDDVYQKIIKEESKTEQEGWELEVRQELVNVLDEHGQIQWEDDPSGATEKAYKIRYLDANGNITDEANAVHKAAFVGCTYHCG